MATYKKRGDKPQNKKEKQTAIENESTTAEVFNTLDEKASKTEAWVAKNQKYIFVFIGVVAAAVLLGLAYNQYVTKPKNLEASNEIYQAQMYFEQALNSPQKDSLMNLALNGGLGKYGFLDIIENYGRTDAANLSQYYAGMAFLHTGRFNEAISHLEKFKSKDEVLSAIAVGAIGDAYIELGQLDKALNQYKKAASTRTNNFTTPKYLLKSIQVAVALDNKREATAALEKLETKYPNSPEATQLNIFKGKVEAMQ